MKVRILRAISEVKWLIGLEVVENNAVQKKRKIHVYLDV